MWECLLPDFNFEWPPVQGGLCCNKGIEKALDELQLTMIILQQPFYGLKCLVKELSWGTTRAAALPGRLSHCQGLHCFLALAHAIKQIFLTWTGENWWCSVTCKPRCQLTSLTLVVTLLGRRPPWAASQDLLVLQSAKWVNPGPFLRGREGGTCTPELEEGTSKNDWMIENNLGRRRTAISRHGSHYCSS